jgi:RNA polymerase sigma factor (sigma-70 family)
MAAASLGTVLRHLRTLTGRGAGAERTDGELLQAFVRRRDQTAFATLVRRHGPMVQGVCRRVLQDAHDAEDAFQATFLVLVQQAEAIRKLDSVGSWLYGVAYRTALRAKSDAARRRNRERQVVPMTTEEPPGAAAWQEMRAVLDEELHRLPEKYRAPFVLCYLEGHTNEQAARRLGFPLGSLSKRLARARHLLRNQLSRRGVTLSTGLLFMLLAERATARVTAPVVQATVHTALQAGVRSAAGLSPVIGALAEAVHKSLVPASVRLLGVLVLALTTLALGVGWLAHQAPAAKPLAGKKEDPPKPPASKANEVPAKAKPKVRTDCFGDALPDGALVRMGTVRFRAGFLIYSLAVSPDGKRLVTGAAGRTACLWDLETGKLIRELGRKTHIMGVAYSPDGKKVAVATNPVRLYEAASGQEIAQLEGHQNGVLCVAFSPNGKMLASSSHDQTIRLWDLAMAKELRRCEGHQSAVYSVAFSRDGKTLASGSLDKTVRLWDPDTGKERRQLLGHTDGVNSVALSADGKWLASGSADKTVRLWDVAAGKQVHRLKGHDQGVRVVAFSPNSQLLASGGPDPILRLWQVPAGKEVHRIDLGGTWGCWALAFSSDGKTLLSGGIWDSAVHFWDVSTGKERRRSEAPSSLLDSLAFSPDGKTVITATRNKPIYRWDAATGKERGQFSAKQHGFDAVAFSPDAKTLAVGGYLDATVRLWDLATGKKQRTLGKHAERVGAVAFSPDGKLLASGGKDNTVLLWKVADGKEIRRFTKLGFGVTMLAFTPDGTKLVVGGDTTPGRFLGGNTFRLLEVANGKVLRKVDSPQAIYGVAFTPDGKLLASAGDDNVIRLFDVAAAKEVQRMQVEHRMNYGPAFSPDGRLLATGGEEGIIHLWETATGSEIRRFLGHSTAVMALSFSTDGRTLASGSADSTALIWDVTSHLQDGQLRGRPLSAKELDQRWADLASGDAAQGYPALWDLAAAPGQSIPLLREKLRPPAQPDPKRLAKIIADLDSKRYVVRQKATIELEKLGDLAEHALRTRLTKELPLESRQRLDRLLQKLEGLTTERLRTVRALTVLEQVGTSEARALLATLAKGPAEARLTREAKAVLKRLERRSRPKP